MLNKFYSDDIVHLDLDVKVDTLIGVHERERKKRQTLDVGLSVRFIFSESLASFETDLEALVIDKLLSVEPKLLERMAYELGCVLLSTYPYILEISLCIQKPKAIAAAKCSFVRMHMKQIPFEKEEILVSNKNHVAPEIC